MLKKMERVIMLKDLYGPLLTDKQAQVLSWYYEQDLSLTEIAELMDISKQAVHDLLRRSEKTLREYENRLGWLGRFEAMRRELEGVCALLNGPCDDAIRHQAVKTLRTLLESM